MASPLGNLKASRLPAQPSGWPRDRKPFRTGDVLPGTKAPEYSSPTLQSRPYADRRYPGDIAQVIPPPPEPIVFESKLMAVRVVNTPLAVKSKGGR